MGSTRLGAGAARRREVAQFVGTMTEFAVHVIEQPVQLERQHSADEHTFVEQTARPVEQLLDVRR